MDFSYNGKESITIKTQNENIAINSDKSSKATISIFSHRDKIDHNEEAFVVDGPGEYEIRDVVIKGIDVIDSFLYVINVDGIKICFLTHSVSKNEVYDEAGDIDVLCISLKGITAKESSSIIKAFTPKVIVAFESDKKDIDLIKKSITAEVLEGKKFSLKKKDFTENKILVLN